MILAAVLGVVGGAGVAFAQAPQPMPAAHGGVPAVEAPAVAPAQPLPAAPYAHPALPAAYPTQTTGGCCGSTAAIAQDYFGGCSSGCESYKGRGHHRSGGGRFHRAAIGEGCAQPIGCGSCASEKTFLFGSCDQFFNPGDQCGHGGIGGGCGHGGGGGLLGRICGRANCAIAPVGTGGLSSPPCTYTSYMNR